MERREQICEANGGGLVTNEIVEALIKAEYFEELPAEELHNLAASATVRHLRKREVIYFPGDPRDQVFLIDSGRVKLARVSSDGREVTLAILETGELLGESALVLAGRRETLAEALTTASLISFRARNLQQLMEKHPKLHSRVTRLMARRRILVENRVEDLAFRTVPARLARALLLLAKTYGEERGNGYRLDVRLSQQELGNLIGSTRETTNHFLNEFRRNGLIAFDHQGIDLLEPEELRQLSSLGDRGSDSEVMRRRLAGVAA